MILTAILLTALLILTLIVFSICLLLILMGSVSGLLLLPVFVELIVCILVIRWTLKKLHKPRK